MKNFNFYLLRMKASILLLMALNIPLFLYAQSDPFPALYHNLDVIETFSFAAPMALSPFWTLFITALVSTLGIENSQFASNPMLNNNMVLALSFIMVLVTTLPSMTKVSKPIALAAKFLEDQASYFIFVLLMLAQNMAQPENPMQQGLITFGILDIPFSTLLLIGLVAPYFIVVMTVRYFLEILIFLSPLPLLDGLFELAQKGFALFLIFLFFIFPWLGFAFSILIFFISFLFFKRALKATNFFEYIYVQPILFRIFRKKQSLSGDYTPTKIKKLFSDDALSIRCLTAKQIGRIPSKNKVWLVKNGEKLFVCRLRFLRPLTTVQIYSAQAGPAQIGQDLSYLIIQDDQATFKLLLNNTYFEHMDDICKALDLENIGKLGLARKKEELSQRGKQGLQKLTAFWSSGQIRASRDAILKD